MSLGSRIIKRGKAANVASLASTPREPLLFLYPKLPKNSSTTPSELAFLRNGWPRLFSTRNYTSPSMAHCNATIETRDDTPHETDPVQSAPGTSSEEVTNSHVESSLADERVSMITGNGGSYGGSTRKSKIRKFAAHPRVGAKGPSVPKFRISKAIQIQKQASTNKIRDRYFRKVYQANRREQAQSWIPDWREILQQLRKSTPQNDKRLEKAVNVLLPDSAVRQLLNGVDDNIWDIADKYDCSVELANRKSDKGKYNEFVISGSAAAISRMAAEVVRIAPDSKLNAGPQALLSINSNTLTPPTSTDPENQLKSGVEPRLVSSQTRRSFFAIKPKELSRPFEWTTHTFADYVADLTSIKMPNHLHKVWYKKNENHIDAVVEVLREIFSNPDCTSSISRTAFNQAISFFVKTAHIPDARAFFVLMETMEIPMNPETFNILLRGAAKQQDLHVFQFILHLMLQRAIMPNGQTWIAFLMANYDFRIKTYIVATMKQKGLLSHTSTLKGVCQQLITQEVNASLDFGQSQDEFLEHMDSRYGDRWLTVDSGNRVLYALGARCLISRCWDFLQAMDGRHIKPNEVSINTILNHCKQARNVTGAIEIMESLPSLFHFVPDEHTYHALFELAWRSRSYNLARVVWKYACLNAGTSRRMRLLVRQSLLNAENELSTDEHSISKSTRYAIWKRQAGLVIASNVYDHPAVDFPELPSEDLLPGVELQLPEEPLSKILSSKKAVDELLRRGYEDFQRWVPNRAFGDMLREAWERDRKWQTGQWDPVGLNWKLQKAIAVPLRDRREQGHSYQIWK